MICSTCGQDATITYPTSETLTGEPWDSCPDCLIRDLSDTAGLRGSIVRLGAIVRRALRLGPPPEIRDTEPAPPPDPEHGLLGPAPLDLEGLIRELGDERIARGM